MDLFSRLSEHLPRQQENYLTQCLATVFDRSHAFRRRFADVLGARGVRLPDARTLRTWTQEWRVGTSGHSILDMVLSDDRADHAALEVKFAARAMSPQIERHLANLARNVRLVLLTPSSEVNLPARLLDRVTLLSWGEVARCVYDALRDGRTPEGERWMLEEYMLFVRRLGVVPPDPVATTSWRGVIRLTSMTTEQKRRDSGNLPGILAALAAIVARLEAHRDHSWQELRDGTWRPYTKLWRYDEEDGKRPVSILSGFYKRPAKQEVRRRVYAVNFGLELALLSTDGRSKPPCLSMWWHRALKKRDDFAGDARHTQEKIHPRTFSSTNVKAIFASDWDGAQLHLADWMSDGLTRFKKSVLWADAVG